MDNNQQFSLKVKCITPINYTNLQMKKNLLNKLCVLLIICGNVDSFNLKILILTPCEKI